MRNISLLLAISLFGLAAGCDTAPDEFADEQLDTAESEFDTSALCDSPNAPSWLNCDGSCTYDLECPYGQGCVEGSCATLDLCNTEADCGDGQVCANQFCRTPECELGDGPVCSDAGERALCLPILGTPTLIPLPCAGEKACLEGACVTETQKLQGEQIASYIEQVRNYSGHPYPADWEALQSEAIQEMLKYQDPKEGLMRGAIRFQRSLRQGHQSLYFGEQAAFDLCGETTGLPYHAQTFYAGVCGQADDNGILVTGAPAGNALGLQPGELVVGTLKWGKGKRLYESLAAEPACTTRNSPTLESERSVSASTFFGLIDEGMKLRVRGLNGQHRWITVPAREASITSGDDFCLDPFGGYNYVRAELTMRNDGVAVIRTSTLRPKPWVDGDDYFVKVQEFIDEAANVVAQVPDGAPIIWDIRGNSGGSAEVAAGIVAGMPGAVSTDIGRLYLRRFNTDPFEWYDTPAISFPMTVSDTNPINHRNHPTAVLIDGLTVSAGDYFAYAAKNYANALIVGPSSTNGQYGFGGWNIFDVPGPELTLSHRVDPTYATDGDNNTLERTNVQPDLKVPYNRQDVANGIDTVLEAAAAALLAP